MKSGTYIYYFILIHFFTLILSGYGSPLERLNGHSNDWYIFLFSYVFMSATIYFTNKSMEKNFNFKSVNYILKHSTRVKYAIFGTVFLLIGTIQLIWNIIPYRPFPNLLFYVTGGIIVLGIMLWVDALYDPMKQKINLKMLKRDDVIQKSETKPKYHLDKKLKKRIYFWLSIGTLCSTASGLIHIFKTNNQQEGVFQIIGGLCIAIFCIILFEYIDRKSRDNNKHDESQNVEE